MKKLLPLLFLLLIFSGCDHLPGTHAAEKRLMESLSPYYQTEVSYQSGDLSVTASIDSSTPDRCTVSVTEPAHLAGYTFHIDEGGIQVEYHDLTFVLDPSGAATAAPLLQIEAALAELLRPAPDERPAQSQEGVWMLSGSLESGSTALYFPQEGGSPTKLSIQGGTLEITLKNFVFFG